MVLIDVGNDSSVNIETSLSSNLTILKNALGITNINTKHGWDGNDEKNKEPYEYKPTKINDNKSMRMSIAANLSGKAINISKTTAPHALSYPLTAYFDIPHGQAVSLTLNEFLKFNYETL